MKVDHGSVDLPVQEAMHALVTTPPVSDYWVQSTSVSIEIPFLPSILMSDKYLYSGPSGSPGRSQKDRIIPSLKF